MRCETVFYSLIGLYLGTNDFITLHPIKYATAQIQKIIKYPAGFPSNPINCILFVSATVNNFPADFCSISEPNPPAIPPIPTTEAVAAFGNISLTVVKRLADHD